MTCWLYFRAAAEKALQRRIAPPVANGGGLIRVRRQGTAERGFARSINFAEALDSAALNTLADATLEWRNAPPGREGL